MSEKTPVVTPEMRDLAIELWKKHAMKPEELDQYESIRNITAEDVLNSELNS